MAVLDAVRSAFFETNEFIDSALKKECEKKRWLQMKRKDDCRWGNFFASKLQNFFASKKLAGVNCL